MRNKLYTNISSDKLEVKLRATSVYTRPYFVYMLHLSTILRTTVNTMLHENDTTVVLSAANSMKPCEKHNELSKNMSSWFNFNNLYLNDQKAKPIRLYQNNVSLT